MFDVMADWLTVPLMHEEAGNSPKRLGLAHPSIAPYGVFRTADGKSLLISIQSDREWSKFAAQFLEDASLATNIQFATNVARVANRTETDALVAAAFARMDEEGAIAALTRADVAFAAVNDMSALSVHPHLRRIEVQTQNGPVAFPAPAPIFADQQRAYGPVPALGEHEVV